MKKSRFLQSALSLLIFFSGSIYAQKSGTSGNPFSAVAIASANPAEGVVKEDLSRVSVYSMRDFKKRFGEQLATWSKSNDTLFAKFSDEKVSTMVGYAKNGRWLYTLKHFNESEMPEELRHMVRSQYYDFQIAMVYEMIFAGNDQKVYIIDLANGERYRKMIQVYHDEIRLLKQFKDT